MAYRTGRVVHRGLLVSASASGSVVRGAVFQYQRLESESKSIERNRLRLVSVGVSR